jgi:hypothetical protein
VVTRERSREELALDAVAVVAEIARENAGLRRRVEALEEANAALQRRLAEALAPPHPPQAAGPDPRSRVDGAGRRRGSARA